MKVYSKCSENVLYAAAITAAAASTEAVAMASAAEAFEFKRYIFLSFVGYFMFDHNFNCQSIKDRERVSK